MYARLVPFAAAVTLALTSCSPTPDDIRPSDSSPSPSITATATSAAPATGAPTPSGPCPARSATMDDATARQVANSPTTGETWLPAPERIPVPAGNATESESWWQLGARGDVEILAMEWGLAELVVAEREPDGTLTWIGKPTPTSAGLAEVPARAGMTVNNEQCYESLALPSTLQLPDGHVVTTPSVFAAPTEDPLLDGDASIEDAWGGMSLLRLADNLPQDYDANALPEPAREVDFAILTPFGTYQQVPFDPFDGDDALSLSVVDYYDLACGSWTGSAVWGGATTDADWTVVGQLGGRDVAVATASNPYAQERYAAYAETSGTTAVSYQEYIAQRGLVGVQADGGGWWLGINPGLSARNWC